MPAPGFSKRISAEASIDEDLGALREIQQSMVNLDDANGGEAELLSPVTSNLDGMMALLVSLYGQGNADAMKKLGRDVEENILDLYKSFLSNAAAVKGFTFESLEELDNRVNDA